MAAFDHNPHDFKYLRLLSRQFPTEQSAFTEIINLSAILNLPKGHRAFYERCAWRVRSLYAHPQ